jgi:hypothetical protein
MLKNEIFQPQKPEIGSPAKSAEEPVLLSAHGMSQNRAGPESSNSFAFMPSHRIVSFLCPDLSGEDDTLCHKQLKKQ